jgi:hypothetical protein
MTSVCSMIYWSTTLSTPALALIDLDEHYSDLNLTHSYTVFLKGICLLQQPALRM